MTEHRARRRVGLTAVLALIIGALVAGPAGSASALTTADDPAAGKLLLMLDASGSMNEPDPSGLTKIEAAKKALTGVVDALPTTSQVGLRVYGATVVGGTPTPEACADTQLAVPIGPLDKAALTQAINGFVAKGETPIAGSLTEAIKDLGPTGKRNIILVSDGKESCVPDPCPVIRDLIGQGIDLQIDTVGFAVDDTARTQLQCIADAGRGTYYDAADADQLATTFKKLSVRAVRSFSATGTPVKGVPVSQGQPAPTTAPTITAGQYVDSLTTGTRSAYRIERTIPNSAIHVSVTAAAPGYQDGHTETTRIYLDDTTQQCHYSPALVLKMGTTPRIVTGTNVILSDHSPTWDNCGHSDVLGMTLARDEGNDHPLVVEIVVIEEPPVTNAASLPAPLEEVRDAPPSEMGAPQPVIGGSTFSDAAPITAGTWTESFMPGETIFYRVPVAWGQQLKVTLPTPTFDKDLAVEPHYDATLYAPDRDQAVIGSSGSMAGGTPPVVRATPEIRWRNREITSNWSRSLAGQWFVKISMPTTYRGTPSPIQVTFRVDVDGQESGVPTYAGAPKASPSPTGSPSGAAPSTQAASAAEAKATGMPWGWVAGGVALLAVAGAAAYGLVRRQRHRPPAPPGPVS
ncbi:MAG: VWA domain-containing protein [Actinobacteria bacterium]|nr:VWA domain-containing protein [Actinomycetota bacterium]